MKKLALKALVVLGVLVVGGASFVALANVNHQADRDELMKIKGAYEQALSNDSIDTLTPYLDQDFNGTLATGAQVGSAAELKRHWGQVRDLVGLGGRGGRYTVKVNPTLGATMFVSDVAVSFGTTDESLIVAGEPGKTYDFHSSWVAVSRNRGGGWKLASIHTTMLNPQNTFRREQLEAVGKLVAQLKASQQPQPRQPAQPQ